MPRRPGEPSSACVALALALGLAFAAPGARAEDLQHTVSPGETLSSIARRYLGDAARWLRLRDANPGVRERQLVPGSILSVPAPPPGSGATVVHVRGSATLLRWGQPRPLAVDMEVLEGDEVQVAEGSYVTVRWPEGVFAHLLPASRLRVTRSHPATGPRPPQRALELLRGTIESAVPPGEAARQYLIRTRWGAAAVRGTRFGVRLQEAGAMVTDVTEGTVELAGRDAKGVPVPAGNGGIVGEGDRRPRTVAMLGAPAVAGALQLPLKGALQFPPVPQAVAYELQLATAVAPALPILQLQSPQPSFALDALPEGQYSVSVRALDANGIPGRPAGAALAIVSLASPLLSQPANDAILAEGAAIDLSCSDVPGAERYEFEVRAAAPEQPARSASGTTCAAVIPALPTGQYTWTVQSARDLPAGGVLRSPASAAGRFTVVPRPAAPAVRVGSGQGLRLQWEGVPDARYLVQVARDLAFGDVVSQTLVEEPQALLDVPPGQAYYVRIKTLGGSGVSSDFSQPRIVRGAPRLATSDGAPVRASDGTVVEPQ